MKRIGIAVVALLLLGTAQSVFGVYVHFEPDPLDTLVGDTFTLDLYADIAEDEQILGWDVDLIFDSSQVALLGVTAGGDWVTPATPMPDDDVSIAGLAGFGLPLGTGVYGDNVLLATLSWRCLAAGTSTIDIANDDMLEGFQLASFGFAAWDSAAVTVIQTDANPTVPVPSALVLGLLGAVGVSTARARLRLFRV